MSLLGVPASNAETRRASGVYARLQQGKSAVSATSRFTQMLMHMAPSLLISALLVVALGLTHGLAAAGIAFVGTLVLVTVQQAKGKKDWNALLSLSPKSYANDTVAQTYYDDATHIAQAKLALACELARNRTALTRIKDASASLENIANTTHQQAESTSAAVVQQNQATQQIASAGYTNESSHSRSGRAGGK